MTETTEQIIERLKKDLRLGEEADRRYAAEDVEDGGYVECLPELVEALKDDSIPVAEAAASALAKIKAPNTASLIIANLATENIKLRNMTCEVLAQLGQEAVDVLNAELKSPDRDVRKFVVDTLLMIASEESIKGLIAALKDKDVNVASTAADGLGQVGDSSHVGLLAPYLNSDTWMKCAVIRAIGSLGGEEALNLVLPELQSQDMLIRITSIQALGAIAEVKAFIPLFDLMEKGDFALYSGECMLALDKIVEAHPGCNYTGLIGEGHLRVIERILDESPRDTKSYALIVAAKLDELVLPHLRPAFNFEDPQLQDLLVLAVCGVHPEDFSFIEGLMSDRDGGLLQKTLALRSIISCGGDPAKEFLLTCLNGRDEENILAALGVVEHKTRPVPLHEIKHLLEHENPMIRMSAAEAAGRLSQDEFAPALVAQLNSEEHEEVKQAIDNALLEIGNETENSALGVFLESFSPEERKRALSFFGFHDPQTQLDQFTAGLEDENPEIRVISYKIFANIKKADFDLVEKGLQDTVDNVWVEAVRCLRAIDDKEAVFQFICKKLEDSSALPERTKVEMILIISEYRGDNRATDVLLPLLGDSYPWVQIETVEALKNLDDQKAIEPLKSLLDDSNPELVDAVYNALDELN